MGWQYHVQGSKALKDEGIGAYMCDSYNRLSVLHFNLSLPYLQVPLQRNNQHVPYPISLSRSDHPCRCMRSSTTLIAEWAVDRLFTGCDSLCHLWLVANLRATKWVNGKCMVVR